MENELDLPVTQVYRFPRFAVNLSTVVCYSADFDGDDADPYPDIPIPISTKPVRWTTKRLEKCDGNQKKTTESPRSLVELCKDALLNSTLQQKANNFETMIYYGLELILDPYCLLSGYYLHLGIPSIIPRHNANDNAFLTCLNKHLKHIGSRRVLFFEYHNLMTEEDKTHTDLLPYPDDDDANNITTNTFKQRLDYSSLYPSVTANISYI